MRRPAAIAVDIEGTVGAITFVKDTLFPYARTRLRSYVREHHKNPAVAEQLRAVAAELGRSDATLDEVTDRLEEWSDQDRKAGPLKALQGMIWEGGYRSGQLVAHVYDDAVRALRRWHAADLPTYVYSSGSVAAQRLYFAHTAVGDLTPLLAGYFDTTTGQKQQPDSYGRIATAVGRPPESLLFLSDVAAELIAARSTGFSAVQVRREPPPAERFEPAIASFDEIPF